MDLELVVIFGFVLIVLSIIGASVNGIISKATAYYLEKDERENGRSGGANSTSDLAERTAMIEDRLRVLERLATDRGQMLSDEIDALRDLQVTHSKSSENA
ncbi:hypothetical protein [Erythrobacter sp. F6033]|uniref:hypothetical protein n=1 Tax=Erythrobacter sp. F6033 TaxID=2926401 RepID=UPI001FF2B98E|nr:hypothetical protein [Erythrobacter sp. F6033]MCK0127728.1 hypothetical protein [Erythrobacter sp. F6033]